MSWAVVLPPFSEILCYDRVSTENCSDVDSFRKRDVFPGVEKLSAYSSGRAVTSDFASETLSSELSCEKKLSYFVFVPEEDNVWQLSDKLNLSHLKGAPNENLLAALKEFSNKETLKEQIQNMLDAEVIVTSASPRSAPMISVMQKTANGLEICPVIDFRALNQVTKHFVYPLPLNYETLDILGGAKYFTTMDCISGFWQVRVNPEDQEKIGFSTPDGHYHALCMPFGLINTPSTFAKLMNDTLASLKGQLCFVYLDDTINLKLVFEKLRSANLKFKPEKCHFVLTNVKYLVPKMVKEICQFIVFVGYYRRFIPNFSKVAQPLTELTKDVAF
ncbi:hypothetical protein PR048_026457 [Dryococelus australis]|uniref:Reverse transcriptase domain-containing protein n=1 Tax=Dryococelus australis TaxID=614101 RepID=A0ABQ9GLD5_9NEOP|nr:hypothetical protein PR048_026457 [Dryococelus australis]